MNLLPYHYALNRSIYHVKCEPQRGGMEALIPSLEKILSVMRNWFTLDQINFAPAVTH